MAAIDYTAKDFASLRQAMLDDARVRLPEWTSRSPNDFGVVLIEEFAYVGDVMSHYIDRLANESFLSTATLRESVLAIAQMLDYRPDSGHPATTVLTIGVVPGNDRILIPRGSQFSSPSTDPELIPIVIFETDSDLYIDQTAGAVAYGTVAATQGETVDAEEIGTSTGALSQVMLLERSSVIEGSVGISVDEGSGSTPWLFVEHLIDVGPFDPVFTTFTNAFGRTEVRFGDGVNGRVPFSSALVTASYRVGGGVVGNVGAQTIDSIVNAPTAVSSVSNQAAAFGGTDAETDAQIRINAPRALSTLHRAVSLEDYRNIALNVAGIAKANAEGLTYTNIVIAVAPTGGGLPTVALKQRVLAYLQTRKMVNANIVIADPEYVPINITVSVTVARQYAQATVRNAVGNAVAALVEFDKVDFGETISVSDVYRAVTSVPGVESATITRLGRVVDSPGVADIALTSRQIPAAAASVITIAASGGITAVGGFNQGFQTAPGAPGLPIIDSLSCPTPASQAGHFNLQLHWNPATDAATYQVLLDFFNGATYVGSKDGGTYSTTNANITGGQTGADTVVVHIRAHNNIGFTDGPSVTTPYACSTNMP